MIANVESVRQRHLFKLNVEGIVKCVGGACMCHGWIWMYVCGCVSGLPEKNLPFVYIRAAW